MAQQVEWIYKLIDQASKQSDAIAKSVETLAAQSAKAEKAFTAMEKASARVKAPLDSIRKTTDGLGKSFFNLSSAAGLDKSLGSIASGVAQTFMSIGRYAMYAGGAIAGVGAGLAYSFAKAQMFKETTLTSLGLILRDGKAAKDVWNDSIFLADRTPLDTQGVVTSMKSLLALGMNKDEARFSFQAMGDVASLSSSPEQALEMMTLALGQMKAAGKANMQDLRQIVNWSASAGVGISQVYETIAQQMGKQTSDIPKMMEQGLISGEMGVFAILKTFQDKVSNGSAGSVMLAQSRTLTGILSNLKSAPFNFFQAVTDSAGFNNFKDALFNISEVFKPTTAAGQKVLALLTDMVDESFTFLKAFSGEGGQERFADWLKEAALGIRLFISQVKTGFLAGMDSFNSILGTSSESGRSFSKTLENIGSAVGLVLNAIGIVSGFIVRWGQEFKNGFDLTSWLAGHAAAVVPLGVAIGEGIVNGMIQGILNKTPDSLKSIAAVAAGIIATPMAMLDMHSPSKVFEDMGRNTIAGFNLGVENEPVTPMISSSGAGNTAIQAPVARGAGGGGRGAMSFNINLSVDARGGDGAEIARKVAELLPGELMSAFEAMAIEGGVA